MVKGKHSTDPGIRKAQVEEQKIEIENRPYKRMQMATWENPSFPRARLSDQRKRECKQDIDIYSDRSPHAGSADRWVSI